MSLQVSAGVVYQESAMKFLVSISLLLNIILLVFGEYLTTLYPEKNEADLVQHLFKNYQKVPRPVNDPSTPVVLSVEMTLLHINQLDEENQVLEMDTYVKMVWKDENLHWNPLHYRNITTLSLPSSDIWIPDLALYTATPASSLFPTTQTRVVVNSAGTVHFVPMFTLRNRCPFSFILDEITCHVMMGSWTYNENLLYIQLIPPGLDLKYFSDDHRRLNLKNAVASRESKLYPESPDLYSALHFNFTLGRFI